ncbi:IS481 family transposase [Pseudonocardia bannensis]|uniref:IS481 family transposase n=1 Tax=Pseudonocardia bannensis TaxID=630973 RepID=UPI0028A5C608|nr:IS481 family transposase [Pseudonocardia bannensis]
MDMSVVEQRYRAVLAVQAGETAGVVAAQFGVSRQSVQNWLRRYRSDGLAGLVDQSRRPDTSPRQTAAKVERVICEMRREHPRWGARRIAHELARAGVTPVPSRATVHRVLRRHGMVDVRPRRRPRESYLRWERQIPMALWQLDIVGGIPVLDEHGRTVEAKIVTGVDDHSRFAVIATVVARATGRAVCLAFAEALHRYGIPAEVLTDNGKQFTARFGRGGGEVLFDRICRDNAITHRLTQPASPTTTGKVERFHQTLRRELLNDHPPFASLLAAQAAVDSWIAEYNCARPHQGIAMAYPADRFGPSQTPEARAGEDLLPLRLPPTLTSTPIPPTAPPPQAATGTEPAVEPPAVEAPEPVSAPWTGGPVEFDRVVPPSGNLGVMGKQFWLGPARAGVVVTFWADHDLIHLLIAGARVKTLRSHLSSTDLAALAAAGGRAAGPSPLPPVEPDGAALEVDRTVGRNGCVSLGQALVLAAEILAGRRVTIRIDPTMLAFFDPDTRQLLRTRPNTMTWEKVLRLRGTRPAGPPPRPNLEPVTVQRRTSNSGTIMVTGQVVALGRLHRHHVVTVHVAEHTLTIELPDGDQRVVSRTTNQPVRSIKAHRPRTTHVS